MSQSAPRVLLAASAFFLGSTALYAADMPVKAVPLPMAYSWAGAYVGVNAGGVFDHMGIGAVPLALPGLIISDPNGAVIGEPTFLLGLPGTFPTPSPNVVERNPRGAFAAGGQIGYNFQAGNIVYGLEADVDVTRSQKSVSAASSFNIAGTAPGGAITRTMAATFNIERDVQASIRGRVGYAWDRLLVYATGGIAGTSVTTSSNFVFNTTIGPAATLLVGPPPVVNAAGQGASQDFYGPTIGGGFEYAFWDRWSIGAEYRYTDFGKRTLRLATQPLAGAVSINNPVDTTLDLRSHMATVRLNYRFTDGMRSSNVAMAPIPAPVVPARTWGGCYVGAHAGVAWGHRSVDTFDPSTNGPVFTGPFTVQTPFFNTTSALASGSGAYSYDLTASGMGGGQLGCNWQGNSPWVLGAEAEGGAMRLSAQVINPYAINAGFNDHLDSTTIGNWYGTFAGRAGYAVGDMLFYLKGGIGFTHIDADSIDICLGTGLLGNTCSSSLLIARGSSTPAFFVVGGGGEWMFADRWSFKAEYLYMGLDANVNVCGPGTGRQFAPNLTFCANHNVGGIHTAKFGVNFKLF